MYSEMLLSIGIAGTLMFAPRKLRFSPVAKEPDHREQKMTGNCVTGFSINFLTSPFD